MLKRNNTKTTNLYKASLIGLGMAITMPALSEHQHVKFGKTHTTCNDRSCQRTTSSLMEHAVNGDIKAQLIMAHMYHTGRGIEQDIDKAIHWYRQAAEHGVAEAQFQLGLIYLEGDDSIEDEEVAIEWLWEAKTNGHEQAEFVYNNVIATEDLSGC